MQQAKSSTEDNGVFTLCYSLFSSYLLSLHLSQIGQSILPAKTASIATAGEKCLEYLVANGREELLLMHKIQTSSTRDCVGAAGHLNYQNYI